MLPLPATVSPAVAEGLEGFVRDLRARYGPRLRRVILFGSAARGTMRDESDVDVLVLLDMDEWRALRELVDVTFPYLTKDGLLISALAVRPERWDEMRRTGRRFAKNVEREGIILA